MYSNRLKLKHFQHLACALVYCDLNLGIIFVLAASSISVYSVMVSGRVSYFKYSIDATVQAAAQMISYEVAIGLIILCLCIPANSFNLSYLIVGQEGIWYVIPPFPMFVLLCVSALAETHIHLGSCIFGLACMLLEFWGYIFLFLF